MYRSEPSFRFGIVYDQQRNNNGTNKNISYSEIDEENVGKLKRNNETFIHQLGPTPSQDRAAACQTPHPLIEEFVTLTDSKRLLYKS